MLSIHDKTHRLEPRSRTNQSSHSIGLIKLYRSRKKEDISNPSSIYTSMYAKQAFDKKQICQP